MTRLEWDKTGERTYETGSDRCVLYLQNSDGSYPKGEAWNGFMSLDESPSGADNTKLYANNDEYVGMRASETFGGTIGAYTTPDSFAECDGHTELIPGVSAGQQVRKPFGLTYRTLIGNDTKGTDYGYKIHLVYGATVSPSEKSYSSVNDSPEAVELSYEFEATKVPVTGGKPTAHLELDSTKLNEKQIKAIEDALYGTASDEAHLPLPDEVVSIITAANN